MRTVLFLNRVALVPGALLLCLGVPARACPPGIVPLGAADTGACCVGLVAAPCPPAVSYAATVSYAAPVFAPLPPVSYGGCGVGAPAYGGCGVGAFAAPAYGTYGGVRALRGVGVTGYGAFGGASAAATGLRGGGGAAAAAAGGGIVPVGGHRLRGHRTVVKSKARTVTRGR